ncbi:hypothetical protein BSKO_08997 [Bryopsis sp. KO-2023]|nr:hypothetical protein BSKO_08997 [Bryopsis sp. KO-2023]
MRSACISRGAPRVCRSVVQRRPPIQPPKPGRERCRRLNRDTRIWGASPNWNPQSVPDPKVMPSLDFGPEDCVKAQLDSMRSNDEPWPNHGLQTMYVFAEDAGGMERSYYFGFSKDLYHFDHFLGGFPTSLPEFMNLKDFDILEVEDMPNGMKKVKTEVVGQFKTANFAFVLKKREVGMKKGCWMTKAIVRKPE